jgi:hypothetical protein
MKKLVVKYRITYPSGKKWTDTIEFRGNLNKSEQECYEAIRWIKSLNSDARLDILSMDEKNVWE